MNVNYSLTILLRPSPGSHLHLLYLYLPFKVQFLHSDLYLYPRVSPPSPHCLAQTIHRRLSYLGCPYPQHIGRMYKWADLVQHGEPHWHLQVSTKPSTLPGFVHLHLPPSSSSCVIVVSQSSLLNSHFAHTLARARLWVSMLAPI